MGFLGKGFLDWDSYIKGFFIGASNPRDSLLGHLSKGLPIRNLIYRASLLGLLFKGVSSGALIKIEFPNRLPM